VALSRDGTTLYYCTSDTLSVPKDGMSHLRLMRRRLETGEERPIYDTISPVSFLHSLSLSPDERQLAFGEVLGFASVLKVVPTDGGPARDVLPKFAWGVDWTRDGRYLLARGTWTDGKVQLLVVPLDGGQVRPTGLRTAIPLALHPDGRHIAFQDGGDDAAIVAIKNLIPRKTAQ
jgi:hypothetical protein